MIYYPHFEIHDEKWLKFALLYYKEINPIIPTSAEIKFTPTFESVMKHTDLIKSYNPSLFDGKDASLKAIDIVTNLLKNKNYISPSFETNNIETDWSNRHTHTYEIYREKFSDEWISFCLENKLGTISENGIKTNNDLAFIYMSAFANHIADQKNISTITDNPNYDSFLRTTYKSQTTDNNKLYIANRTINFMIPKNLDEIPLSKIISIRNSKSFESKISAFHTTLEKFVLENQENLSASNYYDFLEYNNVLEELATELQFHKLDLITFGVAAWSLSDSNYNSLDIISAGTSAIQITKGIRSIKKRSEPYRMSKKFLADLRTI